MECSLDSSFIRLRFCFTGSRQIETDRGQVMDEHSVDITSRVMRYA